MVVGVGGVSVGGGTRAQDRRVVDCQLDVCRVVYVNVLSTVDIDSSVPSREIWEFSSRQI